jgi:hypothetical protein|tara:strand:- start:1025 stop:1735 length:711 start_codon:yes stop_codon:yes gene_type:complete
MGLLAGDLNDLVLPVFEIDSFKSKMGDDKDIVVCSFSCMSEAPAKDLMNFFEKGYPYVLDADVTSGEQTDGTYKVFVEIERHKDVPTQVLEMLDGVGKLANIDKFKFRYYKSFKSQDAQMENISATVPLDKSAYEIKVNENNMDNYKNFFNKSYLDSIDLKENKIKFSKIWADTLTYNVVDFGKSSDIETTITEKYDVNSFAEIIFLTKYIGDYNISKYGDNLLIENNGYTVVLKK